MSRLRAVALSLSIGCGSGAAEMVADGPLLEAMSTAAWPVVDGRDLAERSQEPIPGAVEFNMELALSAPHVLVVANDDEAARALALTVEARFPAVTAVIVAGGMQTLRPARGLVPSLSGGMPRKFVIPSDTCQVGEPLHVYSDDKGSTR